MDLNPINYLRVRAGWARRVRDEVDFFQRRYSENAHEAVLEKLKQADLSRHYRRILLASERELRGRGLPLSDRLKAWFARG